MMKNPRYQLIGVLVVLLVLIGAGCGTFFLLRQEKAQQALRAEARHQEQARLALWRLEALATRLVLLESVRPLEHYRARIDPTMPWPARSFGPQSAASPLLSEPVDHVWLYFEIDPSGRLTSPQVEDGTNLSANDAAAQTATYAVRLQQWQHQLKNSPIWSKLTTPQSPKNEAKKTASAPGPDITEREKQAASSEIKTEPKNDIALSNSQEASVRRQISQNRIPLNRRFPSNEISKARSETVAQAPDQAQPRAKLQAAKNLPAPASPRAPLEAAAPPSTAAAASAEVSEMAKAREAVFDQAADENLESTKAEPTIISEIDQLSSQWLDQWLVLTRRIVHGSDRWTQGLVIDGQSLEKEWLNLIKDLLPTAKLIPLREALITENPMALASLPLLLVPGDAPALAEPDGSPVRYALITGWALLLAALGLGFGLIRQLWLLSERRAAFVSSVTHELRTPLSTFKLYSEMLADELVPTEEKRRQYLNTLSDEADRLSHLVENVLAYSRLEHQKTPSLQPVSLHDLWTTVRPRLEQRLRQLGEQAQWHFSLPDEIAPLSALTEPRALEQILFNLIDNACKYGRAADGSLTLTINFQHDPPHRQIIIRVSDKGTGVSQVEAKKLFEPFHKSAHQAAQTVPGVGLGLALCRRLAQDIGGSLHLLPPATDHGACFELRLPAAT